MSNDGGEPPINNSVFLQPVENPVGYPSDAEVDVSHRYLINQTSQVTGVGVGYRVPSICWFAVSVL